MERRPELGLLALLATLSLLGPGCGREAAEPPAALTVAAPVSVPEARGPRDVAVLRVRHRGEIRIELLPELAPKTVDNFVELAEQGFYDGTTFHRVIPEFAIQGGDPNSRNRDPRDDGLGDPGHSVEDEFSEVSHLRGIVSLANRGRPNSAGSQFFIVVQAARPLDGKYTVFGRVLEGMDVVDAISRVERDQYGRRGPRDRPLDDVVIEKIQIERGAADRSASLGDNAEPAGGGSPQTRPAAPPGGTGASAPRSNARRASAR